MTTSYPKTRYSVTIWGRSTEGEWESIAYRDWDVRTHMARIMRARRYPMLTFVRWWW